MSVAFDEIAEQNTGVAVEEADSAEVMRVLDERARLEIGLSGEEFLDALRLGKFADSDSVAIRRLSGIASLLG